MAMVKEISGSPLKRRIHVERRTSAGSKRSRSQVKNRSNTAFFGILLLSSGGAALIYQIIWIKQLSLIVGVEVYSVTIGVSAFFAGLAIGSFFVGRYADRLEHPLMLYCGLESGIAILGILATLFLGHAAKLFAATETHFGVLAWAIPFTLVGIPALLIGGTLPVAVRSLLLEQETIAGVGGIAYSLNTAGGIAGTLICPFILLPYFGILGTAFAAAALNLTSALIAFRLSHAYQRQPGISVSTEATPGKSLWIPLLLYAIAGGIALGYEVVWSQAIVQFLTTRSFAFSIVLGSYLAGLALGSAFYVRWLQRISNSWGVFGFLIAAAGMISLAEISCLGIWQLQIQAAVGDLAYTVFGSPFFQMCARFFIAAMGIVFIPTFLLGAAFPAAIRLIAAKHKVGRDIGVITAVNMVGGISGSLLTGFLLVPKLGLVKTMSVLALAAGMVGIFAVFRGPRVKKQMRWIVGSVAIAIIILSIVTPSDRLARLLTMTRGGGSLVFYQESKEGTVAVVQQSTGTNLFRRLYIQGVSNSGDVMPSLRYMRLQALLPLVIHGGDPHSALVIGFGTGITSGALLQYPQLTRRVCAELLPAVIKAGALFHGNYDASNNPNLDIRIRDGRRELMRSSELYDLITLESPPPSAAGVVNLYSRDFYQLAATRLRSNGLFAQWLPIATQNDEDTRSLVRSFLDAFPYATLWTTELHEMLLIGSLAPIELDTERISQRFSLPSVSDSLREVGIASPAALLATWVTGTAGLEEYAGKANPVTDNRPRIEYSDWVRSNEITRVLPKLLALRVNPPLSSTDSSLSGQIDVERNNLMTFYDAGLDAYKGDRQAWMQDIRKALRQDSNNPYYRWAVGEQK